MKVENPLFQTGRATAAVVAQIFGIIFFLFTKLLLFGEEFFPETGKEMVIDAERSIFCGSLLILSIFCLTSLGRQLLSVFIKREKSPDYVTMNTKRSKNYVDLFINLLAYLNMLTICILVTATGGVRSPYIVFYIILPTIFFMLDIEPLQMAIFLTSIYIILLSIQNGLTFFIPYFNKLASLPNDFFNSAGHIAIHKAMLWFGFIIVCVEISLHYKRIKYMG